MPDTPGNMPGLLVLLAQALESRATAAPAVFYTVAEAATLLKLCEDTIRRRIRDKKIPSVRVGREFRIPASYFDGLTAEAVVSTCGSDALEVA